MTIEVFDSRINGSQSLSQHLSPPDRDIPHVFKDFYPFILTGDALEGCDNINVNPDDNI